MPDVISSAVERVAYTPETATLDIWYKGSSRYTYAGVPAGLYRALLAAPSIGTFVNLEIKDRYPFEIESSRRRFRPD